MSEMEDIIDDWLKPNMDIDHRAYATYTRAVVECVPGNDIPVAQIHAIIYLGDQVAKLVEHFANSRYIACSSCSAVRADVGNITCPVCGE